MMIPGGASLTQAAGAARAYQPQQTQASAAAPIPAAKEDMARRFDSVTISENWDENPEMAMKSRLSQEVRTATSTDRVAALREQVRGGTYRSDPVQIARKMLLMGEAV